MKRIFTWFLCLVLCLGAIPGAYADPPEASGDTLRVGYSFFNGQFSPFLAETAYDQDAVDMTQIDLLTCDRTGAMVLKGIEGETHIYGTDSYTYYGPADLTITENADFTVYYDFTLRSDLKFSDGTPLTVDDVIFSMYVLADPTYSGTSTFFALPIQGMNDYRAGFDTLVNLLIQAGRDNTDFTYWTEAVQTAFWDAADQAALALAWDIVDYLVNNGYCEEGDIQGAAAKWGFDIADNTIESFVAALWDAYGNDIITMMNVERTTATCITVELGEYNTIKIEPFVECLGGIYGVLTGHGVNHEKDFCGVGFFLDVGDFVHHLLIDGETSGGIDDYYIVAVFLGLLDGCFGDFYGVLVALFGIYRHLDLLGKHFKLLDSRRTVNVARNEQRLF